MQPVLARAGALLVVLVLLSGCARSAGSHPVRSTKGSNDTPSSASRGAPSGIPHLPHRTAGVEDRDDGPYSPFDTRASAINHLDPDLLAAVQKAALSARRDGVALHITSGWRSRAHQQRLLDQAVAQYGSLQAALRWVSTPDTSAHVRGEAVDVGPEAADTWLEQHGATWGLCRVFANEIWHFELATKPGGACPALLPDSSYRAAQHGSARMR
jgi:hypothetical protein